MKLEVLVSHRSNLSVLSTISSVGMKSNYANTQREKGENEMKDKKIAERIE